MLKDQCLCKPHARKNSTNHRQETYAVGPPCSPIAHFVQTRFHLPASREYDEFTSRNREGKNERSKSDFRAQARASRIPEGRWRGHRRIARAVRHGRSSEVLTRASLESRHAQRHAHAQPGQDRLQGRNLLARRPGRSRAGEQLRRRRAHRRARSRPRRQLHRHFVHLRRSRPLERAVCRQGDGSPPQHGLSRHQNQRAHARRLHAHDREIARAPPHRPCRPLAVARHRHA